MSSARLSSSEIIRRSVLIVHIATKRWKFRWHLNRWSYFPLVGKFSTKLPDDGAKKVRTRENRSKSKKGKWEQRYGRRRDRRTCVVAVSVLVEYSFVISLKYTAMSYAWLAFFLKPTWMIINTLKCTSAQTTLHTQILFILNTIFFSSPK